jgi:hypothetical protein
MREFIIVTALCLVAAFVADHVWLGGKYFGAVKHELGLEVSSVNRR